MNGVCWRVEETGRGYMDRLSFNEFWLLHDNNEDITTELHFFGFGDDFDPHFPAPKENNQQSQ